MRQIIHLDLDAFYASVEALLNPDLRGKPLVVAMGNPQGRGVVATAAYEARRFGVHSAMPLREALRLCPQIIVVPVRHALYAEYSQRVMQVLRDSSPLVEQVSIDEAYVEIEPERDAAALARAMQARIQNELGLSCTLAVATSKLVSKVACNTVKPHGFIVVPEGTEQAFLAPLPIGRLPYAGPATRARLARWNIKTIGDLTRVPVAELRAEFGKHGIYLSEAAHGRDDSPVVADSKPKSVSQENTFERDTRDVRFLEKELAAMSERVAHELEHEGYLARTIVIKLRYADFSTITRQTTLRAPTASADKILECAVKLLRDNWDKRPVRLIGVGTHGLVEAEGSWQLELGV
ncbi:MAG: DNA polymerase IV [Anaerolineae bacterium]